MKKLWLFLFASGFALVAAAQQDTVLQQYTGKYKFPEGSVVTEVTVTIENGMLMATSNMGGSELRRTDQADVFEIVAYAGTATFRRKEGKVNGVQMIVGDTVLEGTKTDDSIILTNFYFLRRAALAR